MKRITIEIPDSEAMDVTYEASFNGSVIKMAGHASYSDSLADIEANLLFRLKSRIDTAVGASETLRKDLAQG